MRADDVEAFERFHRVEWARNNPDILRFFMRQTPRSRFWLRIVLIEAPSWALIAASLACWPFRGLSQKIAGKLWWWSDASDTLKRIPETTGRRRRY